MRPGVREEVGCAVNSSDLAGRDTTVLNALAMGADELGALLWRAKYGGDRRPVIVAEIREILVARVDRKRRPSATLVRLVESALGEWLDDGCRDCRGRTFTGTEYGALRDVRVRCPAGCSPSDTGTYRARITLADPRARLWTMMERAQNAVSCQRCGGRGWIPGSEVDASKTTICRSCNGTNVRAEDPARRAAELGVTRAQYERVWAPKYERVLGIMRGRDERAAGTVKRAMHSLKGAPGVGG